MLAGCPCSEWGASLLPQEVNKILEEKFKTGKNRWFFQKLRF